MKHYKHSPTKQHPRCKKQRNNGVYKDANVIEH